MDSIEKAQDTVALITLLHNQVVALTAERDIAVTNFESLAGVKWLRDEIKRLTAERDALKAGYIECVDELWEWASYASAHFQAKYDLPGTIAKHEAALRQGGE